MYVFGVCCSTITDPSTYGHPYRCFTTKASSRNSQKSNTISVSIVVNYNLRFGSFPIFCAVSYDIMLTLCIYLTLYFRQSHPPGPPPGPPPGIPLKKRKPPGPPPGIPPALSDSEDEYSNVEGKKI